MKRRFVNIVVVALVTMTLAGLVVGSAQANLPSCSNCIESGDIAAGAVKASELNNDLDDSITANDIAAGGVGSSEIKNGSVTSRDVASSVATQAELDAVADFLASAALVSTARVTAAGSITASWGLIPFTSGAYDATDGRYELLVETTMIDQLAAVVTPNCSTAPSWYTEMQQATSTSAYVHVYLKDSAGAPEECGFSLLLA